MHYLKLNNNTLKNIAKVGYLFDTTTLSENLDQQYLINGLTEIPFHIMEGKLLGPEVNYTLAEIKQKTLDILNQAVKKNKKYVGVLFHQRYFSNDFPNYKKWYTWLINYCKEKKYNFVNYKNLL